MDESSPTADGAESPTRGGAGEDVQRSTFNVQRGFSLVELVVVTLLMSLAVMLAAEMVVQSIRLVEGTGKSLRDPAFVGASMRLRRDVHQAAAILGDAPVWSTWPLELRLNGGGAVRVEATGGELVRTELDATSKEISRTVLVRGVRRWRWRKSAPMLVEFEVTLSMHRDPWYSLHRSNPSADQERTETLTLAVRGGGRTW